MTFSFDSGRGGSNICCHLGHLGIVKFLVFAGVCGPSFCFFHFQRDLSATSDLASIGSRCASLGINYAEIDDALVTLGNKRATTATTRPSFPPFVPSSTLCCSRSAAAVLHVARVHPSPVVGQARSGWFRIFQAIFGLLSGGWNRSTTTCPARLSVVPDRERGSGDVRTQSSGREGSEVRGGKMVPRRNFHNSRTKLISGGLCGW